MISQDFSKVKHLTAVQIAVRAYKAAYAANDWTQAGGAILKQAENELNAAIESAIEPK